MKSGVKTVVKTADIKDIDKDIDNKKDSKEKNTFIPPTLDEVKNYVNEKGLNVDAEQFYNYFTEGKWVDSKGNNVKNWKQKILTWNGYTSKPKVENKQKFNNYEQRTPENLDNFYVN